MWPRSRCLWNTSHQFFKELKLWGFSNWENTLRGSWQKKSKRRLRSWEGTQESIASQWLAWWLAPRHSEMFWIQTNWTIITKKFTRKSATSRSQSIRIPTSSARCTPESTIKSKTSSQAPMSETKSTSRPSYRWIKYLRKWVVTVLTSRAILFKPVARLTQKQFKSQPQTPARPQNWFPIPEQRSMTLKESSAESRKSSRTKGRRRKVRRLSSIRRH